MAERIEEEVAKHPESPTTGQDPDFDDDTHETASGTTATIDQSKGSSTPQRKSVSFSQDALPAAAPAQPPRPKNPYAEGEATLAEAFPSIDAKVIKAVLMASGGKVEPAFNALLAMSDPDAVAAERPPTPQRPSRPLSQPQMQQAPPISMGGGGGAPRGHLSQIEQDELYARQLADHYNTSASMGFGDRTMGEPRLPRRNQQTNLKPNELYDDRDHSFFDDDLPVIKQSIQKGFQDTQKTFNKWINNFVKKVEGDDGEDEEEHEQQPRLPPRRQNFGPSQSDQLYGIRKNAEQQQRNSRRSGERERYDADPRVLGDDFTQLELHDNEDPRHRTRPLANPDLFKPLPTGPTPQSGPVDEVDALYRQPTPTNTMLKSATNPSSTTGTPHASSSNKKWQPLTSIAPHPDVPDEHDPFSLGDSDEELEKEKEKKTDLRPEDSERLKSISAQSVEETAAGKGEGINLPKLEEQSRSGSLGTKDAIAESLLTGEGKKS